MKLPLCAALVLLTSVPVLAFEGGRDPASWIEEAKLHASDGDAYDYFGVASALDGDTAIITAPDDGALGSAYVFVRTGATWSEQAKLVPADGGTGDGFGYYSAALCGDTALIGRRNDDEAGSQAGSAYVFVRSGATWIRQAKLLASDPGAVDLFGGSVSLDGDTALIGAKYDDHAGGSNAGSAYVLLRSGSTWSEQAKLVAGDAASNDYFGSSVSVSGDTALVGSPNDGDLPSDAGSAYVFVRSGASWSQQAKLLAGDPEYGPEFGYAVSLSGDTAVLGVPFYDGVGSNSGAACVFERSGTSWSETTRLTASDATVGEYFGRYLSSDGDRALIGAPGGWMGSTAGSAYVFEKDGSVWRQQVKLEASDGELDDAFGAAVSLSGDSALIGACLDDDLGHSAGAAYVFAFVEPPGAGFCFGDPGSGTPCPCSNDNDGSVPGSGCDNGVFASGAKLTGLGTASVSEDSVVLSASHLDPLLGGLYFQATTDLSPGLVWGDGLRCAGGSIQRLQVRFADAAGLSSTTVPIGAKGNVVAGDTVYYQCWYRTTSAPPCGPGVNDFNTTNGYEVRWIP